MDMVGMIEEVGGETNRKCFQCSTCSGACPWGRVSDAFRIRETIRLIQFGLEGYEEDQLWRCVSCNQCVDLCPQGVEVTELLKVVRGIMNEMGSAPPLVKSALGSTHSNGNPWSGPAEERCNWAKESPLPAYEPGMDFLLYQCCTPAYDPRGGKVGQAMLELFRKAGVSFGVVAEERCCGEALGKCGDAELFESLREHNSEQIAAAAPERIVVASPHCLDTFRKDYGLGEQVQVIHVLTLLRELIDAGKLVPSLPVRQRVTYHDPCYMGRHNGIYDDPRAVLQAIPGLELVEMEDHREFALCCGGGGGGLWSEVAVDERFGVLRWEQAERAEASVMCTACPYCLSMLEDGRIASGREESHQVFDVIELLARSIA